MAIHFFEGFGWANVGTHDPAVAGEDLKLRYANWIDAGLEVLDRSDAHGPRKAIRSTSGRMNLQPRVPLPTLTSFVLGFPLEHSSTGGGTLIAITKGGSFVASIVITASNRIAYTTDSAGRTDQNVVAVSAAPVPRDVETFIELEVTLGSGTDGSVDFYINGVLDSQHPDVGTVDGAGVDIDGLLLLWAGTAISADPPHSDHILSGIYVADSRLGPRRSYYAPADSVGSAANHTPSGSPTNHECVDEVDGHDGDNTHVAGTGVKDSLGISFSTTLPVEAVQALAAARGESGPETVQVGILSGATEVLGPATGVSTDYGGSEGDVHETDPDTAAAWDPADLGDVEVVLQS